MPLRISNSTVRVRYVPLIAILAALLTFWVVFKTVSNGFTALGRKEITSKDEETWNILRRNVSLPQVIKLPKAKERSLFAVRTCHQTKPGFIGVHVYSGRYMDEDGIELRLKMSAEYKTVIATIKSSQYYARFVNESCLSVPGFDTLTDENINIEDGFRLLPSLKSWNGGRNHLIFNMFTSSGSNLSIHNVRGHAILASAGQYANSPLSGHDVSIPTFNSLTVMPFSQVQKRSWRLNRKILLLVDRSTLNTNHQSFFDGRTRAWSRLVVMDTCERADVKERVTTRCYNGMSVEYPFMVEQATFCLVMSDFTTWSPFLLDSLMLGCIPVVMESGLRLPFDTVLDWKRAAVSIHEHQLPGLMSFLLSLGQSHVSEMRRQALYFWVSYLSTLEAITLTTLHVLNGHMLPQHAKSYEEWNGPASAFAENKFHVGSRSPIFYPLRAPTQQGFTAVILTYNRIKMLFELMAKMDEVPSLAKIVVVWNNPEKDPPHVSLWPVLRKPFVVIRRKSNRLSNRFYPYKDIVTEGVFAIDDDILMLTVDEIEFAYRVWCEFPDRLVGFPGRHHVLESTSSYHDGLKQQFKYDSEWDNDMSMVLTGAAFYHKVYGHHYTHQLPQQVRDFVDARLNCEDIAMNFMIANLTRKAPIKVTPRKRFKCSQCGRNESLWSEHRHFVKRSECLSVFTRLFGYMPLVTVEFRADPVLYKGLIPYEYHSYRDIGMV